MKINSISTKNADFPKKLRHIPDKPARLYYTGNLPDDDSLSVAIIGSRRPTAYGQAVTEQLAGGLAARGVAVISGLALGIDSIGHKAALEAGGKTYAVLPGDLDHIYPRSHLKLAQTILEKGGGLISEANDRPQPARWDFLSRNRFVSGLADAVVITEANHRSGTMSTVSHALAQGRDVYAVPGPITSPLSAGCNRLIAQGATPICDVQAFIDEFAPIGSQPTTIFAMDDDQAIIIELLRTGVADGDELIERSRLNATSFNQAMTMLELNGAIHALGGNQWRL